MDIAWSGSNGMPIEFTNWTLKHATSKTGNDGNTGNENKKWLYLCSGLIDGYSAECGKITAKHMEIHKIGGLCHVF